MIFLTITYRKGLAFEGPKIIADNWQNAELYCAKNSLKLDGVFVDEIECDNKIVNYYLNKQN
jgi:hypothetical protein